MERPALMGRASFARWDSPMLFISQMAIFFSLALMLEGRSKWPSTIAPQPLQTISNFNIKYRQRHPKVCLYVTSAFLCFIFTEQKKLSAYAVMANAAKEELSGPEYVAAIWARKALAYELLDDPMFRQQFGPCIPPGFNRKKLSEEMHLLVLRVYDVPCMPRKKKQKVE